MKSEARIEVVHATPDRAAAPAVLRPAHRYESWGRWPKVSHAGVIAPEWSCDPPDLTAIAGPLLPFGLGRSYGDVCLNEGGVLIDTTRMNRLIAFDRENGTLHCEAGTSLASILDVVVPAGWFPAVTPGTRFVTVGGAIANDIHGKNHHRAGTFGRHVLRLELLRSDGRRVWCSPEENAELFAATIGGLGLTGLILSAEIRLRRVPGPAVAVERIRYGSLREFFALCDESDAACEYTVAWVDGFARGPRLGRGIFMRGDHVATRHPGHVRPPRVRPAIPFEAPAILLAPPLMRAANRVYYRRAPRRAVRRLEHYERFFYPLDAIRRWNLLYGRTGFLQYQCVVPPSVAEAATSELLALVAASRGASFLAVLKRFGDMPSPGMLSFPRPGVTLALDIAIRGADTFTLCDRLDRVVAEAGGAVYPCKDARMSAENFRRFFPALDRFRTHVDPGFSSSFWRRAGE